MPSNDYLYSVRDLVGPSPCTVTSWTSWYRTMIWACPNIKLTCNELYDVYCSGWSVQDAINRYGL